MILLKEEADLSLISTHAFPLSPVKFFAWDMRRVVKWIELAEKYLSLGSHLKFKHFNFCEISNFSGTNQTSFLSHVDISRGSKKFHKMVTPQLYQA